MKDYQLIVDKEKSEIDIKIKDLGEFIFGGGNYGRICQLEQAGLKSQYNAMRDYSRVLAARIAAFT